MSEIIKEKTSADHLHYVSLKYTKTCDIILNLLARWKSLIEISFDSLLQNYIVIPYIAGFLMLNFMIGIFINPKFSPTISLIYCLVGS